MVVRDGNAGGQVNFMTRPLYLRNSILWGFCLPLTYSVIPTSPLSTHLFLLFPSYSASTLFHSLQLIHDSSFEPSFTVVKKLGVVTSRGVSCNVWGQCNYGGDLRCGTGYRSHRTNSESSPSLLAANSRQRLYFVDFTSSSQKCLVSIEAVGLTCPWLKLHSQRKQELPRHLIIPIHWCQW
jgi:hypothetical protein